MISARDILLGVVLPAVVSGLIMLTGRVVGSGAGRAAPSLGVGLGFVAGHAALFGIPNVPPADAVGWLFYAAGVLAALGALDAWLNQQAENKYQASPERTLDYAGPDRAAPMSRVLWSVRALGVALLALLVMWLLARPLLRFWWTGLSGPLHVGIFALSGWIIWASLDFLSRRGGMVSFYTMLTALAVLTAVVVGMSGSQRLAQFAGMLTAAVAAVALLCCRGPRTTLAPGVALIFALLYASLITAASERAYASLKDLHAALLLAGPLCAWMGELVPQRRGLVRGIVRVAAALLPAAIAALLAGVEFARSTSEYSDYGY